MKDDNKCICYVSMTVGEMSKLPEDLLVEAVSGSIPTHFREKNYMEVLRRARIAPGNKDKQLEILRANEDKSGFNEEEKATILKLHATNLYYSEKAIKMSLYAIANAEFFRREKSDIETVKAVISKREEREAYWNGVIENAMLKDNKLSAVDDFYSHAENVFKIVEIFGLSKEKFLTHARLLIEKNKKELPYYCIKLARNAGIEIDISEYSQIADELIKSANSQIQDFTRRCMAERALEAYEALHEQKQLSVERIEILKEYQRKDSQAAIRKASKLLKNNFTYIPRGFWDTAYTRIFN